MACVGYNDLHKKFSFMRVAGSRQLLLLLLLCVCVSEGQDEVEYMGDPFINKNVVTVVVHFTPPPLPRRMKQEPATEEADSAVEGKRARLVFLCGLEFFLTRLRRDDNRGTC